MQKITPFLWFDHTAEEAVRFYTSLFPNSRIDSIARYPEGSPGEPGSVMTIEFQLSGQDFVALNGGPYYTFSSAISFVIDCADQQEVDFFWDRLGEGGQEQRCGWLTDRFGITWQIVPRALTEMLQDDDREKVQKVFTAMLGMVKLDVAALRRAHES